MREQARVADDTIEICNQVLACREYENVVEDVLKPIAGQVSADTACFVQFNLMADRKSIGQNGCHKVDDRSHSDYTSYFFEQDPLISHGINTKGWIEKLPKHGYRVFRFTDLFDYSELVETEFYQDFFKPNRIHHVMVLAMRAQDDLERFTVFGFHRPKDAPTFSESDMLRARAFAPAALSAVHSMSLESTLKTNQEIIKGLEVVAQNVGVMLVDTSCSVLYANERGGSAFRTNGSADGGDSQFVCDATIVREIERWQARQQLTASIDGRDDGFLLNNIVGDGHGARISPVIKSGRVEGFLLTTADGQSEDSLLTRRMNEFGLTSREQEITSLVAQGFSNQEIADNLCISIRTTENHLRSVYSKVGVNTRSRLMYRLYAEAAISAK